MPALIVAEVTPAQTGVANSVNSIARSVGSSVASAVVVTLLASEVLPSGLPRESAYVAAFAHRGRRPACSPRCSSCSACRGCPGRTARRSR